MSVGKVQAQAAMQARLHRRLTMATLMTSGSGRNTPSGAGTPGGARSTSPASSMRSAPRSPGAGSASGSMFIFSDWEEEESQRFGGAFEFVEEDDAATPLVPHQGPIGWRDEDYRSLAVNPAGPFQFVEHQAFNVAVGLVIVANAAVLCMESQDMVLPLLPSETLNIVFLAVYGFELSLRVAHYRLAFFTQMPDAAWNWMDTAVVASGVLDAWLASITEGGHGHGLLLALRATRVMRPLRFIFRAVRLLRYVRLIRFLIKSDLEWVDSGWFQATVGVMIVLNAVFMGLETDVHLPLWEVVEQAMLAFFVLELIVRIRVRGWGFFTSKEDRFWNWFDLAVVVTGVVDQWLIELWDSLMQTDTSDPQFGQMVTLARMLRLGRVLRLVRVVKAIRPLRQLAIGVVQAMQSMFWVLVLTFVALYSLAILTTRMVGWGQLVDDPETIPAETRDMFSSMADSMFTLFAFMNGHEWHKVRPLLDMLPWIKPLFVAFTICGSWALLSVMTGVVSDHIQNVREQQNREDDEARDERREQLTLVLSQIFASADKQGNGYLSRGEFMEIFASQYQVRRLQRAVDQPLLDIQRLYDMLDAEGHGKVSFREFCEGLDWLEETVTGQRLLHLDSGVKLQCSVLQKDIDAMSDEVQRLQDSLTAQHGDLMRQIMSCLESAQDDPVHRAPGHGALRQGSSTSLASGGSRSESRTPTSVSETTPIPMTPPQPQHLRGLFKYQRSVSSLRSFDTGGSKGLKISKSVSFSELPKH